MVHTMYHGIPSTPCIPLEGYGERVSIPLWVYPWWWYGVWSLSYYPPHDPYILYLARNNNKGQES